MKPAFRLCIIAPVSTDAYNQRLMDSVAKVLPSDVAVEVRNLPTGHDCIQNRHDWSENNLPVVELARQIEKDGFHGIWLSDFDMCGVEAAREAIDIPIIGGFTACALTAMSLCQKFSIITFIESVVPMQRGHVSTYGWQDSFASIRYIESSVEQLCNVDAVIRSVYEAGLKAVREDGAQSLLLGCTGFVGVAEPVSCMLSETMGGFVPVIDPNQAGFSFLVSLVRMKIRPSRLCYSKT